MGNICPQEVVLRPKVCFLYLGNVFALKRYARFKDVRSFLRRVSVLKMCVRFKRGAFALKMCVCFKV